MFFYIIIKIHYGTFITSPQGWPISSMPIWRAPGVSPNVICEFLIRFPVIMLVMQLVWYDTYFSFKKFELWTDCEHYTKEAGFFVKITRKENNSKRAALHNFVILNGGIKKQASSDLLQHSLRSSGKDSDRIVVTTFDFDICCEWRPRDGIVEWRRQNEDLFYHISFILLPVVFQRTTRLWNRQVSFFFDWPTPWLYKSACKLMQLEVKNFSLSLRLFSLLE